MGRYRSHLAWTVWPVALLFLLELSRMWPALGGASAFAASSPASWLSLVAFTVVVLVFLVVYARGWNQLRQDDPAGGGPYRSEGCRRLQRLAGGLAWGLVVAHLALQWFMTVAAGPVALSHYELLRGFLSHPLVLVFYAAGLASLGLFLSQGIAASVRAWGFSRPKTSQWWEVGATLASAMVLLLAINVLSHFVTGRAYWVGTADRPGDEQADVGGSP